MSENQIVLDVRPIPPYQKHPAIFQTFHDLSADQAMILVNDHDPKPVYYQMNAEMPGKFTWSYLEQGPDVWRVEIRKS